MASQPGQPTAGDNRRSFNWRSLVVAIVFILGIGLFAWWIFFGFGSAKTYRDMTHFSDRVRVNETDDDDGEYFKHIEFKANVYEIYIIEVVAGKEITYTIKASPEFIRDWSGDVAVNGRLKDASAFHDGNNQPDFGDIIHGTAPSPNVFLNLLLTLLPVALIVGFFFWIMRRQGGVNEVFSAGKNQARKVSSTKKFSDVAGQDEVKEEVEEVVDFLRNPARYVAAGARIPKGILLAGPPGTGKTLMAKATAGEAKVPFYFISASNFVEMFAGLGAKRVREMFKEARRASPAILFIDELDAIGRKRGSSLSGNDEREQTLNQILVEMDGMDENTGLLIIAATNRPDVLDPALLRPGRFDRTITINNPDIKEREAILRLHAKGKRIGPDIDFAQVAKRTPGYSGAQLENIINEASLLSVREKTGVITILQIDEAIDRVAAGPARKNRVITPEELKMVSYHEAGHAVIGLKLSSAEQVQKITIIPRGNAGGYTLMTPKKETYNYKKSELEAKIISFIGGRAAEQVIYGEGEVSTGAANDIQRATSIARAMVTQYGMSSLGPIAYESDQGSQFLGTSNQRSKEYSDALAERIDQAIRNLIVSAEKKALAVIRKERKLLELISEELLEKETIVAEEIEYINKHLKRPPKKTKESEKQNEKSLDSIITEVQDENKSSKKATSDDKVTVKKKTVTKKTKEKV